MKEHLISLTEAENNLAAAATYLAENIGSSDGHAEALQEIVGFYIAKGDVDLAAELADTIKDNFVRDNLLIKVAEKCAAIGDDEYAFQLTEAIEERGLQSAALERIAVRQAVRGAFDEALKTVAEISHPDNALAAIASRQATDGLENESKQTVSKIEDSAAKIHSLQMTASFFQEKNDTEKTLEYLNAASDLIGEIELPEEKIRTMLMLAAQYIEAERFDKAIEILGKARTACEVLDSQHRESFLSTTSLDLLRAGSLDLADRTLDLIADKTQIATTLTGFSAEFESRKEFDDALDSLEEAYAITKSQKTGEIQDSRLRFNLLATIAARFAALGKIERALEIAIENPIEDERNRALTQIAVIFINDGNEESARQALDPIDNETARATALIKVSDALFKSEKKDNALIFLNEAYAATKNNARPSVRTNLLNEIAAGFFDAGESEKARHLAGESFQAAKQILDESHRAVALLRLAEVYEKCGFELNETEKSAVGAMLRKTAW